MSIVVHAIDHTNSYPTGDSLVARQACFPVEACFKLLTPDVSVSQP